MTHWSYSNEGCLSQERPSQEIFNTTWALPDTPFPLNLPGPRSSAQKCVELLENEFKLEFLPIKLQAIKNVQERQILSCMITWPLVVAIVIWPFASSSAAPLPSYLPCLSIHFILGHERRRDWTVTHPSHRRTAIVLKNTSFTNPVKRSFVQQRNR